MVLRYATIIPEFLDTSPLPPRSDEPRAWSDFGRVQIKEYFDNLAFKSSCTQVCRAWRDVGVEFLYEDLRFTETGIVAGVVQLLEKDFHAARRRTKGKESDYRCLSFFIKRIEYAADIETIAVDEMECHCLASLCCISDNCQILRLGTTSRHGYDSARAALLTSAVTPLSRTLTHLKLVWTSGDEFLLGTLLNALARDGCLQALALHCSFRDPLDIDTLHISTTLSFSDLHTLTLRGSSSVICFAIQYISSWGLPSLQRFSCDSDRWSTGHTLFLEHHGKHITTMTVPNICNFEPSIILPQCPNLQVLNTNVHSLSVAVPPLSQLAEVHLTHNCDPIASQGCTKVALRNLLRGELPVLSVIRVLSMPSNESKARYNLSRWFEVTQERPVRLELISGKLVEVEDYEPSEDEESSAEDVSDSNEGSAEDSDL
jgi:hypothetical protein